MIKWQLLYDSLMKKLMNSWLVALVDCKNGTGKNLCDIVYNVFNELNLNVKNCIGSSTDGTSNMRG